ncbi:ATPase, AAA+ superfamily [Xenorhabdus bovienii str. Jollieti]|uniref:ATPase, AAA+ superfamily n=1 Tax=Xenorhabdus bovienii (strain SS-2004) TaxID=406818 RepID=D3UXZ5_XENBS|nr:ATPase, AAA+ superfamily [Xenorhabdus bovienii SS-2004]CDH29208.1 ATPase, AAA+ superfamily [Xenorhabdus bovienii str. Jollieti]
MGIITLNNKRYPRLIAPKLKEALTDTPVVCLLGPRQVGKTTLVKELESGRAYITFDDSTLLNAAKSDPLGFVQGLPERVTLDEVQRVPEILPALKAVVDTNRTSGRFILTGSANLLLLPGVQESLAGRVEVTYLQPLSEQEKQYSSVTLLEKLLSNRISPSIKGEQAQLEGIADAVVQGGYPEPNTRTEARARQWHKQYLNAIIQRDVKDIAAIRDEEELLRLIKILALRTGNLLNISGLSKDLGLQRDTVDKYITILERLFLVRRLPAWHKNHAKRLLKTPKIHIIDSGLACVLTKLRTNDWYDFSSDFGAVLESFVVQQLICQSGWIEHELFFSHYRDKDQVEVDLVIEDGKKVWGVEVKKAASIQPKDGAGLAKLASLSGDDWQGGIMLYTGNNCLPISQVPNTYAVPMNALWKE